MITALRTFALVAVVFIFSACASDEEKELEPTKLVDIETKVDVKRLWSAKIGDSAEFLRSLCSLPVTGIVSTPPVVTAMSSPWIRIQAKLYGAPNSKWTCQPGQALAMA